MRYAPLTERIRLCKPKTIDRNGMKQSAIFTLLNTDLADHQ